VELTALGGWADGELPTEEYGSPTAAVVEEDHTTGLQEGCRLGSTWVECPPKVLEWLSCPSSPPSWHGWHPLAGWRHS
jgi:hypothetical protein